MGLHVCLWVEEKKHPTNKSFVGGFSDSSWVPMVGQVGPMLGHLEGVWGPMEVFWW